MIIFMIPTIVVLIINLTIHNKVSYPTISVNLCLNLCWGAIFGAGSCLPYGTPIAIVMFVVFISTFIMIYILSRLNVCNQSRKGRCSQQGSCWQCCTCCTCCTIDTDDIEKLRDKAECESWHCCTCCMECCGYLDEDTLNDKPLKCLCCKEPYDLVAVFYELNGPLVNPSEVSDIISENISIPPFPEIEAQSFIHTPGYHTSHIIVTETKKKEIAYGSWEDESEKVKIDNSPMTIYNCQLIYKSDESLQPILQTAHSIARSDLDQNLYICSFVKRKIPGLATNFVAAKDEGCVSCARKCSLLYEILFFFGYNSIFDLFWRWNANIIQHLVVKRLSGGDSLRAKPGERDNKSQEKMECPSELQATLK